VPVMPGAEPFANDGGDVGVLLCHGLTGTPQSLAPWAHRLADEGLTVDRGDQVAALVVVNPAFLADDRRLRVLPVVKHLVPSLAAIGNDIAKAGSSELAYDRTPLKALHSFVASWGQTVHDLPKITQPLLVLRSRVDHVVPPRSSALLLSRVSSKDVTEVVLENSFHVATLDNDADLIEKTSVEFIHRVTVR